MNDDDDDDDAPPPSAEEREAVIERMFDALTDALALAVPPPGTCVAILLLDEGDASDHRLYTQIGHRLSEGGTDDEVRTRLATAFARSALPLNPPVDVDAPPRSPFPLRAQRRRMRRMRQMRGRLRPRRA